MKTLKNSSLNILAILTEKTVYLASAINLSIYKQFGISTFNQNGWVEIEPISDEQFEKMCDDFKIKEEEKKKIKEIKLEEAKINAYNARKEEIINLWNWRKGRIDAFIVHTFVEINEYNKSCNVIMYSTELIFGEEKANARFEELKKSETPCWDNNNPNNCYFVTEILSFYETPKTKLDITTLEDLKTAIYNNSEIISRNDYAPSIEDFDYIITFNKYNRYHNETNRGKIQNIEPRRTWSGWIGSSYYSEQRTTADLDFNQIAVTFDELVTDYYSEAVYFNIIE